MNVYLIISGSDETIYIYHYKINLNLYIILEKPIALVNKQRMSMSLYLVYGSGTFSTRCLPGHPAISSQLNDITKHESDARCQFWILGHCLHAREVLIHQLLALQQYCAYYILFTKII